MANHSPLQPANGTASASDIVQRVQLVDSSGNVGVTTGGSVDTELPAAAALSDTFANPTAPSVGAHMMVWTGSGNWARVYAPNQVADGTALGVGVSVGNWVHNGASWDRQRTPNKFLSVNASAITAGTGITIWTPTAGKKFRLMGFSFSVSAAAGLIFGDNAVGTVIFRGPLLGAAGFQTVGACDMGNGFLSAAANNVLKLDVSANATVTGYVWGTEE